ncbi:MAG: precorrin-6y C5,15-methyltransferase (decarboxylating) subunit CbiE [Aliihoeflea sp.]
MSSSEQRWAATSAKWLSIVGIGEDGVAGLGEKARRLVSEAEFVFGGKRHLTLAESLINGKATAWPSPFSDGIETIRGLRGRRVCVLASGDPFLHGVGATLARHVPADEMDVVPAPSAFSLAAARLGWPLADIDTVSLHGRPLAQLRPWLHPGRRILTLTSDASGPSDIAALLRNVGFGKSKLTVLEALGGPDERMLETTASGVDLAEVHPLNLVAVEVEADADAPVLGLAAGLPDEMFEHDGQITKREIRAATLSALAPRRGELLWDIGAGSGSVSLEWVLLHPSMSAISIEAHGERVARIGRNAESLGVTNLQVVEGTAPDALSGLPAPDAIFVGGGGSRPGVMAAALAALKPGGRLVANAVTLEMEAVLLDLHASQGGALKRLSVQRAERVGSMTGWRAAMPVTQWAWTKPQGGGS